MFHCMVKLRLIGQLWRLFTGLTPLGLQVVPRGVAVFIGRVQFDAVPGTFGDMLR